MERTERAPMGGAMAVSYTHLDVYKRQFVCQSPLVGNATIKQPAPPLNFRNTLCEGVHQFGPSLPRVGGRKRPGVRGLDSDFDHDIMQILDAKWD